MDVILNIERAHSLLPLTPQAENGSALRQSPSAVREPDSVELSTAGRALADAVDISTERLARIRAVRIQIENGAYETPERIEGTVRHLLDVIA